MIGTKTIKNNKNIILIMKVQKHKSDKRGNKQYYKYVIVLPEKELKKANIKEGDELYVSSTDSKKGEIKLKKGEKGKQEKNDKEEENKKEKR